VVPVAEGSNPSSHPNKSHIPAFRHRILCPNWDYTQDLHSAAGTINCDFPSYSRRGYLPSHKEGCEQCAPRPLKHECSRPSASVIVHHSSHFQLRCRCLRGGAGRNRYVKFCHVIFPRTCPCNRVSMSQVHSLRLHPFCHLRLLTFHELLHLAPGILCPLVESLRVALQHGVCAPSAHLHDVDFRYPGE
jgi:hypothetical protein